MTTFTVSLDRPHVRKEVAAVVLDVTTKAVEGYLRNKQLELIHVGGRSYVCTESLKRFAAGRRAQRSSEPLAAAH